MFCYVLPISEYAGIEEKLEVPSIFISDDIFLWKNKSCDASEIIGIFNYLIGLSFIVSVAKVQIHYCLFKDLLFNVISEKCVNMQVGKLISACMQ